MAKKLVSMIPTKGDTKEEMFENVKKELKDKNLLDEEGKINPSTGKEEKSDDLKLRARAIDKKLAELSVKDKELIELGSEEKLKQPLKQTLFFALMADKNMDEIFDSLIEYGKDVRDRKELD
ncbi:hypothetical protein KJ969_00295 [Patescibacteria group bacterium]|nr:hypothetical protein [Patescibacteria group bacterium]MBU1921732.1 hypothetical protein [Patescibacteria group bacterium]